jgi:hypothetical protein
VLSLCALSKCHSSILLKRIYNPKHHLKEFMRMADKLEGAVTKDIVQPLMMRSLYMHKKRFVFPDPAVKE